MVISLLPQPRQTGRDKLLDEGMFELKADPGPGMCCVKGCRKKHIDRKRGGTLFLCSKHYQHRWRQRSPKQSAYHTLKMHAKQRHLEFNLTYDYFCALLDVAGHLFPAPGDFKDKITIDRVEASKGYVMGNLTVKTHSANVAKGNRERFLPENVQDVLRRKREKAFQIAGRLDEWDPEGDAPPF